MEQYIDKSAVVAEIEKLKGKVNDSSSYCNGWQHALRMLELSLDTFEVKEVDLEKEYKDFVEEDPVYNKLVNGIIGKAIAKHFFELGMCAANTLTVKDIEKIYHLVNEVSDDLGVRAMYVNIYKETLKRFKAQKGE